MNEVKKDNQSINDEIREQKKKWKDMTPQQKKKYFADYYMIPTLIGFGILIACIILIFDLVKGSRETYLHIIAINTSDYYMDSEKLVDEYLEYVGVDQQKYKMVFDANNHIKNDSSDYDGVATIKKVDMNVLKGAVDLLIVPEENIANFEEYFLIDLKDYMDQEWYNGISDKLYYSNFPDAKGVAIGFYADDIADITMRGMYDKGTKVVIIPLSNSSHQDISKNFYYYWRDK